MFKKITYTFIVSFLALNSFAQNNSGEIHGNFDLNMQSYQEDELIGAQAADEIILNNAYLNINYTKGDFAVISSTSCSSTISPTISSGNAKWSKLCANYMKVHIYFSLIHFYNFIQQ